MLSKNIAEEFARLPKNKFARSDALIDLFLKSKVEELPLKAKLLDFKQEERITYELIKTFLKILRVLYPDKIKIFVENLDPVSFNWFLENHGKALMYVRAGELLSPYLSKDALEKLNTQFNLKN